MPRVPSTGLSSNNTMHVLHVSCKERIMMCYVCFWNACVVGFFPRCPAHFLSHVLGAHLGHAYPCGGCRSAELRGSVCGAVVWVLPSLALSLHSRCVCVWRKEGLCAMALSSRGKLHLQLASAIPRMLSEKGGFPARSLQESDKEKCAACLESVAVVCCAWSCVFQEVQALHSCFAELCFSLCMLCALPPGHDVSPCSCALIQPL